SIYVAYDNGGFFSFARSDDGGSTWAIADFSIDSATSTFLRPIATDGWDLDVKGDTVAIVTGGHAAFTGVDPNDVVLFLSADRGATWSAQTIHVFDTVNAELDTASGGYIVETPHADVRVLIGADGRIHCGGSIMATLTDPGAFTSSSWFPLARGIWYWNSDMPAGFDVNDPADYSTYVLVDSVPDLTTMGSYPGASADQGNYVTGSFSHPSLSEDANGNLFIVYSGICAGSDNNPFDNRFRRDLFAMKSGDGGMNWSTSKNIASLLFANDVTDGTVGEEAYPVTPKRVQSDIKILFQHDSWAGPTLTDDQPILEQNKMAVLSLDPALISGIEEEISKESLNIYPNPASGTATVTFESNVKGNTNVVVSNMIGQTVKVVKAEIVKGSNSVVLNLSDVNEGIYLVTLGTGSNKITQKLVIE
ncbi:MAG: T9SS type A sorting domain-containing protein, partial [Fulvivirga sp.]